MKRKLIAICTSLCMLATMAPAALAANGEFADIQGHWAEASIERWAEAGVVSGTDSGTFNPNGNMSRVQAAQVFTNLLKLDGSADLSAYTDVDAGAWYADALAACVDKGIMNGVSGNQMNPNGTITREMFFVMFARALGIPEENSLDEPYADSGSISDWAKGYVYALVNHGYVGGTSDSSISPLADINRASVIALLDQTITEYVVTDGTTVDATESGVILILADDVTITGDADVTVAVAKEGVTVSLDGYTGTAQVNVLENDVAIADAPAGTVVTTAENVTGTSVNGDSVAAGENVSVEEEEEQPAPSGGGGGSTGGGSTGGGSTGGGTTPPTEEGGDDSSGDDDEEESVPPTEEGGDDSSGDDDEEEAVPPTEEGGGDTTTDDDEEELQTPDDEEEEIGNEDTDTTGAESIDPVS